MPKIQVLDLRLAKEKTALLGVLLAAVGVSSRLTDRQAAIARIYGHGSWAEMKHDTASDTTDLTEIDEARAAEVIRDSFGTAQGQAANIASELGVRDIRSRSTKLLDRLLETAHRAGASDVHMEQEGEHLLVIHRIEGSFAETVRLPASDMDAILQRLESLRRTKDLPATATMSGEAVVGRNLPIRFTTILGKGPRTIVFRLLRRKTVPPLFDLGISNLRTLLDILAEPSGVVLFVGATGSGKTWTTRSCAMRLLEEGRSVVAIEEVVEYDVIVPSYRIDRREELRLDELVRRHGSLPDVVVMGDMTWQPSRASLALDLSRAGVLVLCEIHGSSVVSGIRRLVDDLELSEEDVLRHVRGAHYQFLVQRSLDGPSSAYPRVMVSETVPTNGARAIMDLAPPGLGSLRPLNDAISHLRGGRVELEHLLWHFPEDDIALAMGVDA